MGDMMMNKTRVFALITLFGLSGFQINAVTQEYPVEPVGKLVFQQLPYSFDALEPYIDKQTMEIHYGKHHKAYYDNFMNSIKGKDLESMTIRDIFSNMSQYPAAVRNNGGGYYNHNLFWENMTGSGAGLPSGKLNEAMIKAFGSFNEFKKQFSDAAKSRFGSGWAWLIMDKKGNLLISSTPNQDNPLMDISDISGEPLLALDVWEHAYYLKYQNKRADYIEAFWSVVNWKTVAKRYEAACKLL
jgi:Fe-Mn family superoxide dismutase